MADTFLALRQNIARVRERISRAVERSGRDPSAITLLAVTKKFPPEVIRAANELGLCAFGENYVQEFEAKAPAVRSLSSARFHLIGHLQSNKARRAAELFDVIQTVDSPKLARRLNEAGRLLDVMIEVKLSEEETKHGCPPEAVGEMAAALRECPHLRLTGLMTMPPWSDDPEAARPYFRRLREIGERHGIPGLSMGMSHDLEAAIEEGATCVRVGTALFGPRPRVEPDSLERHTLE
ncbi:MAG: YggS family pyridoxal phosphate-dependent enzyme [Bryobacterales bacterium]|nr:YggS family pyridoxal phosphate-dependent enzyme [Bryobacterales bacterium]